MNLRSCFLLRCCLLSLCCRLSRLPDWFGILCGSCCYFFLQKFMCFTCSTLYSSLWRFLFLYIKIVFIDFIHKATGTDLTLLFLAALALCFDLTLFITVLTLFTLLFFLQLFTALHVSWFCILRIVVIIILIFFPEFCDYIKNNQKQNGKSKNNQPLNTLGSCHQISDKRNCYNNFRKVASNCHINRLSLRNSWIHSSTCTICDISAGQCITIHCILIIYKDRCTQSCFFGFNRNCICNRSHCQI